MVFIGTNVHGEGFLLTDAQALEWIAEDNKNSRIIFPYLIGDDITSCPKQMPSRFVINFYDWDENKAREYIKPYKKIANSVKSLRQKIGKNGKFVFPRSMAINWWQFKRACSPLYHAIGRGDLFKNHPKNWQPFPPLQRVIVISRVTKYAAFCFVPNKYVMSERLCIFNSEDAALLGILQSAFHEAWAIKMCTTLGTTTLCYTPTIAFATFPRPAAEKLLPVREHAESLHELRAQIMIRAQIGLTELYNNLHNPESELAGIAELRLGHERLDELVAAAYGWTDLDLGHNFRQVDYLPKTDNLRHTIPEATRLELLCRLTALNRERWLAEQAATPPQKGKAGKTAKRRKATQAGLLPQGE